jgi:hypothetical protein
MVVMRVRRHPTVTNIVTLYVRVALSLQTMDVNEEFRYALEDMQALLQQMSPDERRVFAPLCDNARSLLEAKLQRLAQAKAADTQQLQLPQFGNGGFAMPTLPTLAVSLPSMSESATPRLPKIPAAGASPLLPRTNPPSPRGKPASGSASPRGPPRPASLQPTLPATARSLNLGQSICAALFLLCESLMARIDAARVTVILFNESTGLLDVAVDCGHGVGALTTDTRSALSPALVRSVMDTGIAVNLPSLSHEDLHDRHGTPAVNALVFPIMAHPPRTTSIGAVVALNHHGGAAPFALAEERLVHATTPTIAYLTSAYTVDHVRYAFDPTALRQYRPLPPFAGNANRQDEGRAAFLSVSSGSFFSSAELPKLSVAAPPQLIFRREGKEKFVRREQLKDTAEEIPTEGERSRVVSVSEHMEKLEQCWAEAVEQALIAERALKQKQALITEASDLLSKKQRKVDLLKEVLAEHMTDGDAL